MVGVSDKPEQRTGPESNVTRLDDARSRARRHPPARNPAGRLRDREGEPGDPTGYEFTLDLASDVSLPGEQGPLSADEHLARLQADTPDTPGHKTADEGGERREAERPLIGVSEGAGQRDGAPATPDSILAAISAGHLRAQAREIPRQPRGSADLAAPPPRARHPKRHPRRVAPRSQADARAGARKHAGLPRGFGVGVPRRRLLTSAAVAVVAGVVVAVSAISLGVQPAARSAAQLADRGSAAGVSTDARAGHRVEHKPAARQTSARDTPPARTTARPGHASGPSGTGRRSVTRPGVGARQRSSVAGNTAGGGTVVTSNAHGSAGTVQTRPRVSSTDASRTSSGAGTPPPSGAAADSSCGGAGVLAPTTCGKPAL